MNKYAPDLYRAHALHLPRKVSKERMRLRLVLALIVLDILAIYSAVVAVNALLADNAQRVGSSFAVTAVIPIYFICAFMVRAYAGPAMLKRGQSIGRALLALLIAGTVLSLILLSVDTGPKASPLHIATLFTLAGMLMAGVHYGHARFANHVLGGSLHTIVELRDGIVPDSGFDPERGLDTRFFFDPTHPTLAGFERLGEVIAGADRVIVHCNDTRRPVWAHVLQGMNVHAEFMVREWNDIRPLGIGEHNGGRTVVVACGPLNLHDRIVKRGFDIAVSAVALLLLSPLFLAVAIAIRLETPGPAFFIQPRIGRRNQLFSVIKFRSMRQDRCDKNGAQSTLRCDPRVTRIGNFIRRTSIDELPQLINILKGDMSLVGPRPHAVSSTAEDRLFWDIDNRYWHRHACRPGLTGLAQIQGLRGATACAKDLTDRVEADLRYLQGWSIWTDIRIMILTFRVICHTNSF